VGALATGIKLVVLAVATYGLWTMRPWGWLLTLIVVIYSLFLELFELIGGSGAATVFGGALIEVLILLSLLSPQVRNAFAAVEKQRKAGA